MNIQTIIKSASALTVAFSFVGALVLIPSSADAAGKKTYISYGALNGNRAPCSSRSYYNPCTDKKNAAPHPYRRGCTEQTRCARG